MIDQRTTFVKGAISQPRGGPCILVFSISLFALGCGRVGTEDGRSQPATGGVELPGTGSTGGSGSGGTRATGGSTWSGGAGGTAGDGGLAAGGTGADYSPGGFGLTGTGASPAEAGALPELRGGSPNCPGSEPPGNALCRASSECGGSVNGRGTICARDPSPYCYGCGQPCIYVTPADACSRDSDCSEGKVCLAVLSSICPQECAPSLQCVNACTETSCGSDMYCAESGHCVARSCLDGHTCEAGRTCAPDRSGADGHGCAVRRCDLDGIDCPANHRCEPSRSTEDGCARLPCEVDDDCDCGVCIDGTCEDRMFICTSVPMHCY